MTRDQAFPVVALVAASVVLGLVAAGALQLVGVVIAVLVAAIWFEGASPGRRSTRLGPPKATWAWLVLAIVASALLTLPLLAYASLGVANAVFLTGIALLSRR